MSIMSVLFPVLLRRYLFPCSDDVLATIEILYKEMMLENNLRSMHRAYMQQKTWEYASTRTAEIVKAY